MARRNGPLLARITKLCLAFPSATRDVCTDYATFRVRGKPFAYFLDNHNGDGIVSLSWRGKPGENREWVKLDPKRFFLPKYIASRGWVGLRLDVGRPDWAAVAEFIDDSYRLTAPPSLVREL